jgi:hypothetical protein
MGTSRVFRYMLAVAGPVATAGSQFLLSLILLHRLDKDAFGSFSVLLIISQFSWGIWSALFCAPLPVLYARLNRDPADAGVAAMFGSNLLAAGVGFLLFAGIALAVGEAPSAALLFAGYGAIALLRWFARADAYARGRPLRTTASDIAYSIALLAGVGLVQFAGATGIGAVWAVLMIAAAIGLLPFGVDHARRQFVHLPPANGAGYAAIWREHSRWSLLGVVTTEMTANAHAYLVTLLLGAGAFAPIAASSLMIRPITVAMNALTDFERAQVAREIDAGHFDRALAAVRFCRIVLLAAWIATALAVVALFVFAPRLLFPARYDLAYLIEGAILWMLVAGVRMGRTPDSALLQAAGAFRPLALASVWSSLVSVAAVLALLAWRGPIWSIGGILIGEALFARAIWREAKRWLATATAARSAVQPCLG